MLWGMLWIIGGYGAAAAVLHLMYAAQKRRNHPRTAVTTYALITHNNEAQIEWYLRSLLFFSWLRGRRITVVLFDEASTDATIAIASKLASGNPHASIRIMNEGLEGYLAAHPDEAIVLYRITNRGNGEGLPVLQV